MTKENKTSLKDHLADAGTGAGAMACGALLYMYPGDINTFNAFKDIAFIPLGTGFGYLSGKIAEYCEHLINYNSGFQPEKEIKNDNITRV